MRNVLARVTVVALTVVMGAMYPATVSANGQLELLTEPFLQAPTEQSVKVVWFTEFEGREHALV